MTAPTPREQAMEVLDDLESSIYDTLMRHQRAHGRDLGNGTHTALCTCGLVVVMDWKLDAKAWFVGHQAQEVAGLLPDGEEWGVRHPCALGSLLFCDDEADARRWAARSEDESEGAWPVVHRYVTEWRTA